MSYLLPPAGGGFTVGGAVAGAIINEILRNDMMILLQYFLVIRSPRYVWIIITTLYLHNNQQS